MYYNQENGCHHYKQQNSMFQSICFKSVKVTSLNVLSSFLTTESIHSGESLFVSAFGFSVLNCLDPEFDRRFNNSGFVRWPNDISVWK